MNGCNSKIFYFYYIKIYIDDGNDDDKKKGWTKKENVRSRFWLIMAWLYIFGSVVVCLCVCVRMVNMLSTGSAVLIIFILGQIFVHFKFFFSRFSFSLHFYYFPVLSYSSLFVLSFPVLSVSYDFLMAQAPCICTYVL